MPTKSRFTDEQVRTAVLGGSSWREVLRRLDASSFSGGMIRSVRRRADRLGIDYRHLTAPPENHRSNENVERSLVSDVHLASTPEAANLASAGNMIAAAWFALCGHAVSWPLEPCRFDLIVVERGVPRRVQVKTTTARVGETWKAYLSTTSGGRKTYTTDEIDEFFVINGDLQCYRIPLAAVEGLHAVHLSAYEAFRVVSAFNSLPSAVTPRRSTVIPVR